MQEIEIYYRSGSVDSYSLPSLSAENGSGYALDNVYLDFSYIQTHGLCVMRNAVSFTTPKKLKGLIHSTDTGLANRVVIVDTETLKHVLLIKIDGAILFARGTVEDDVFLYDINSDHLVNLMLQNMYGITQTIKA